MYMQQYTAFCFYNNNKGLQTALCHMLYELRKYMGWGVGV